MSRGTRLGAGGSPPVARGVVPAIVLGTIALLVAVGAIALVLLRTPASEGSTCRALAWNALPDVAALPDGWSQAATGYYVDGFGASLVGPTPSDGTTAANVYVRMSCYGSDAHEALARSRAADVAAGGTELGFPDLGDESLAIRDSTGATTSVYLRRGELVAYLSASDGVAVADLEGVAAAVDAAMRSAGSPAGRPTPGTSVRPTATPAASPSPDASASPGTSAAATDAPSHVAPDVEALLPKTVNGTELSLQSTTATAALRDDPASTSLIASLAAVGKTPDDLIVAEAFDPAGLLDLDLIAFRVKGVTGITLRQAILDSWLAAGASGVTTSKVTLSGREVTKVDYADDGPDDYLYEHGDVVFDVWTSDQALAGQVLALLP